MKLAFIDLAIGLVLVAVIWLIVSAAAPAVEHPPATLPPAVYVVKPATTIP